MHSSISSSERRWLMPLVSGAVIALMLFMLPEIAVRLLGETPGVRDGTVLWSMQRAHADQPGAIVLAGDSRMLLDIDVQRLAGISGHPVVQLAIDGQSFQPVLQDLANDDDFRGTVLVDVLDQNLSTYADTHRAQEWVDHWHKLARGQWSAYSDGWLALRLQSASAWYTSEPPWPEMLQHIAAGDLASNYVVTLPDRGRRADYSDPHARDNAYANRVARTLGYRMDMRGIFTLAQFEQRVNALLDQERVRDMPGFDEEIQRVRALVARIRARGGRVVFLRMPSRGLVRRIEDVRFPREMYWDRFAAGIGTGALYFTDDPKLATYQPPDGSHLDRKDVGRYTEDLYAALVARKLL